MSYFVYRITPGPTELVKNLELLESFDAFREAKVFAREQRTQLPEDTNEIIKVIFAESQLRAEELLLEHREPPLLDGNEEPI